MGRNDPFPLGSQPPLHPKLSATSLLSELRFIKDNRLLPLGFGKQTAHEYIAVRGNAGANGDFTGGGDRIRYSMPVNSARDPYRVDVELRYQPISYRWANNLRPYDSMETQRFTRYYWAMGPASAVRLASARTIYTAPVD